MLFKIVLTTVQSLTVDVKDPHEAAEKARKYADDWNEDSHHGEVTTAVVIPITPKEPEPVKAPAMPSREPGTLPDIDKRTLIIGLAREYARQDPKFRDWLAGEVKGALDYMVLALEAKEKGLPAPPL